MSAPTVPTPGPEPTDSDRVASAECECGSTRAAVYSRPRDAQVCPDCQGYRRNPRTGVLGR